MDSKSTVSKEVSVPSSSSSSKSKLEGKLSDLKYEEAFDLTGQGCFNYWVLLTSSLILYHSCLEMVAIGYVISPAECELHLSTFQKSMINSAVYIGIAFTSMLWGYCADRLGRRLVMLWTLMGAVVFSFSSSLCTNFWMMYVFRLLTGCFISATSSTSLVYLGELHAQKYQDKAVTTAMVLVSAGFVLLPVIAWAVIANPWLTFHVGPFYVRSWRIFMWLWSTLGILATILLSTLPESPRFVMTAKGPERTLKILSDIYAMNFNKQPTDYPVSKIYCSQERKKKTRSMQLLRKPMRRCLVLTHGCMFICFLLGYGFYIWLPDLINAVIGSQEHTVSICNVINDKYMESDTGEFINEFNNPVLECHEVNVYVYPMSMCMELFYSIPYIIVTFTINKVKKTLLYCCIMLMCSLTFVLSPFIEQITVGLILLIVGLSTGGCCAILSALTIEAYPTSLRALAMCTMYMSGHIGAVVGTSVIAAMSGHWCYVIFIVLALAAAG